ncbi:hypothetical protein D3C81_1044460 [compost metagenome]
MKLKKWIAKKSEVGCGNYVIQFFSTRWNSKLSIQWYSGHSQWDYQFREGYMDVYLGKLNIRFRRYSGKYLRKQAVKERESWKWTP